MAINSAVKWYSHAMQGLPAQSTANKNVAGTAITLLDAILVDGFNLVTVDSVVVNNNIATVTRSAGLNYLAYQVIEIAGATPSALNGQWRVESVNPGTNSLTFATSGISNQTATGTITIKTPSLGWERVFTDTNKRVYRSPNEDSPRSYFQIDDTSTTNDASLGGVNAYGSMTDVNTGLDQWHAGATSIGIPRNYGYEWFACGDDRTFWIHARGYFAYNAQVYSNVWGFGDYISLKPNDAYNEFVALARAYNGNNGWGGSFTQAGGWGIFFDVGRVIRRGNPGYAVRADGVSQVGQIVSGYSGLPFPSSVGNNIVVTDALIREEGAGGNPVRGKCRGLYWVMSNQPFASSWSPSFVDGVVGLEGRRCAVVYLQTNNTSNYSLVSGRALLDITGPWD